MKPLLQPIPGESQCFNVQSEIRPDVLHRVELDEFEWFGKCTCEDFHFNGCDGQPSKRCKHILWCRHDYPERMATDAFIETRNGDNPERAIVSAEYAYISAAQKMKETE